ncbi:ead/Ea22-like family protein [Klebsiella pneumoniae]
MTTDITELAQSLKAAAEKATPGQWQRSSVRFNGITDIANPMEQGNKPHVANASEKRDAEFIALANPANVLALVEALEKAQAKNALVAGGIEATAKLHERIAELESFRTAYMEWSDKTDWVNTDRRFGVVKPLGKHRADVLKAYIEHLESRTVTVKLPTTRLWAGVTDCYEKSDVIAAIRAAGVEVSDD